MNLLSQRYFKAALFTGGLFFILFVLWLKLDEAYTTETAPTAFEVLGHLERNDFKTLPGLELRDLNLTKVNLEAITKDKIVILNFWASWCEPCAEEFPSMVLLMERYKDKIVILAPSHDSNREDIETFAKAFNLQATPGIHLLWDKDLSVGKLFEVNKLPESYIFGRDGRLLRKVVGTRNWFNDDAKMFFDSLTQK